MQLCCLFIDKCLRILPGSLLYQVSKNIPFWTTLTSSVFQLVPICLQLLLRLQPSVRFFPLISSFQWLISRGSYNNAIPSGVGVPAWAYLDVQVFVRTPFDLLKANDVRRPRMDSMRRRLGLPRARSRREVVQLQQYRPEELRSKGLFSFMDIQFTKTLLDFY